MNAAFDKGKAQLLLSPPNTLVNFPNTGGKKEKDSDSKSQQSADTSAFPGLPSSCIHRIRYRVKYLPIATLHYTDQCPSVPQRHIAKTQLAPTVGHRPA
jgi:hypothetical protein